MNIALIFAGGTGQRMNSKTVPKQFLKLHGKPIIVYTLEHFEEHKDIDGIVIVCLKEWQDFLIRTIAKFGIKKVTAIVDGGKNGQESIKNGVVKIYENYPKDTVVLIHDGVRPIINDELISDNIKNVKKNGNSITVVPAIETIMIENSENISQICDRDKCFMVKAPQCFYINDLYNIHMKALEDKNNNFIDTASMMSFYGLKLYTVIGSSNNIKITTHTDYYLFKAILDTIENEQIIGR